MPVEAPDQVKFVDTLHPGKRCTEIFESHGLLTDKCVMAHCVYLEDGELDTCAQGRRRRVLPPSNAIFSLSPGWHAFPFHKAHAKGVRVGMGTVAGRLRGVHPRGLPPRRRRVQSLRAEINVEDRVRSVGRPKFDDHTGPSTTWARRTSTTRTRSGLRPLGGARALGLDTVLGNFEVGKQFDAVRINCEAGNYDTFPSAIHPCCPSRLEHDFEKFL